MLVGILGRKHSGKDTTADYLCSKYGFKKYALAEPLKESLKTLFNFTNEQLYGELKETIDPYWGVSPRVILQYLGTDIFRNNIRNIIPNIENNFWINLITAKYLQEKICNADTLFVISDVRFQNEIDKIHELGGIVIKINRPSIAHLSNDIHESEKNIDDFKGDYTILNDKSKNELYMEIDNIMSIINVFKK